VWNDGAWKQPTVTTSRYDWNAGSSAQEQRVGRPRHLVVYRIGRDGVVEIMGLIHDRMLLDRAVQGMLSG
jgi:hypothetical protein